MLVTLKNNKKVHFRRLISTDFNNLKDYLDGLSTLTKDRFGPHQYDTDTIIQFYNNENNIGFIATDYPTNNIVAYAIIKIGYIENEAFRLHSYGLVLNHTTYCTYAPSVADAWQSCGVGKALFNYILTSLTTYNIQCIILWGGVQATNEKAINYYKKLGFIRLGEFDYNGHNYDMVKLIGQ